MEEEDTRDEESMKATQKIRIIQQEPKTPILSTVRRQSLFNTVSANDDGSSKIGDIIKDLDSVQDILTSEDKTFDTSGEYKFVTKNGEGQIIQTKKNTWKLTSPNEYDIMIRKDLIYDRSISGYDELINCINCSFQYQLISGVEKKHFSKKSFFFLVFVKEHIFIKMKIDIDEINVFEWVQNRDIFEEIIRKKVVKNEGGKWNDIKFEILGNELMKIYLNGDDIIRYRKRKEIFQKGLKYCDIRYGFGVINRTVQLRKLEFPLF